MPVPFPVPFPQPVLVPQPEPVPVVEDEGRVIRREIADVIHQMTQRFLHPRPDLPDWPAPEDVARLKVLEEFRGRFPDIAPPLFPEMGVREVVRGAMGPRLMFAPRWEQPRQVVPVARLGGVRPLPHIPRPTAWPRDVAVPEFGLVPGRHGRQLRLPDWGRRPPVVREVGVPLRRRLAQAAGPRDDVVPL